jgi:hypothetical protein
VWIRDWRALRLNLRGQIDDAADEQDGNQHYCRDAAQLPGHDVTSCMSVAMPRDDPLSERIRARPTRYL